MKKATFLFEKCLRRVTKFARAHDGKYGRVLRESGGGSLNGARDEVGEAAEETTIKEVIGADKEVRRLCESSGKKATKPGNPTPETGKVDFPMISPFLSLYMISKSSPYTMSSFPPGTKCQFDLVAHDRSSSSLILAAEARVTEHGTLLASVCSRGFSHMSFSQKALCSSHVLRQREASRTSFDDQRLARDLRGDALSA